MIKNPTDENAEFNAGEEVAPEVVMSGGGGEPGGPTKEQYNQVLNVTAGMAEALDKAGVDVQIATSASILLAAELAAQSGHSNKQIIESFRRTFVAARKRWREKQN